MKKTIATLVLAAAAALSASAAFDDTFRVRVASYNIRTSTGWQDTGDKAWDSRKSALCNLVKSIAPDVIGFQEVETAQMEDLKALLPDYEIFGKHRETDNTKLATPVAYRKSRFLLLDGGTFWLSTTPNVQGSKALSDGYTGTDPETCSWALLKDRTSGGVFCFFCTHLDWKQAECRKRQMAIAVQRVMLFVDQSVPAVIVGDMNSQETESSIAEVAYSELKDACLVSSTTPTGPWRTFNDWTYKTADDEPSCQDALQLPIADRNPLNDGKRVDYVLTSPDVSVDSFAIRNDAQPGKEQYPSDHYPIVADLAMSCDNAIFAGKVRVEIDKTIPSVGYGRYVLTQGANLLNDDNLEFVLPRWVQRAAVEDGEIVIYTKPDPFKIHLR